MPKRHAVTATVTKGFSYQVRIVEPNFMHQLGIANEPPPRIKRYRVNQVVRFDSWREFTDFRALAEMGGGAVEIR